MIDVRRVTEHFKPESEFVGDLVKVFRAARQDRLAFLLKLHDEQEDRQFLSTTVHEENQLWVAKVDGSLAGFIAFHHGWVNHLYVAPEFQRQGIGGRLLAVAMAAHDMLQLWVFEANAPAIQFYERAGFKVVERTDGSTNEAKMPDLRMQWLRQPEETLRDI